MGGLSWFAIPFGFATTLGLAAVALTDNPRLPTFPENMSSSQISAGLTAWLVEAKVYYGAITIQTTGAHYPSLAGNLASVMTGHILSVTVSLLKPDNFDWERTRAINAPEPCGIPDQPSDKHPAVQASSPVDKEAAADLALIEGPKSLQKTFVLAVVVSAVLSTIMDIVIPIPMFLSHYVFSKSFFTAWIVISFIWVFLAFFLCGVLPFDEKRRFWVSLFKETFQQKRGIRRAECIRC